MTQPAFYVSKTLGPGNPDTNRRTIYRTHDHAAMATINWEMRVWTPEHERILKLILDALTADEATKVRFKVVASNPPGGG